MRTYFYAGIVCLLLVAACNYANTKEEEKTVALTDIAINNIAVADSSAAYEEPQQIPASGSPQQSSKPKAPLQTPESKPDWNKKIVKTASLNIEVKEYNKFNQLLHTSVAKFGGYIANEQQTESEYKIENTVTLKVPVDQFQAAVDFLTNGEGKINEKNISSDDVTTQYVDTRSRLEAKKQVRLRYLDLLKQAKNMEEILQVQNEINDIQEQIESATGRINYLANASAMSTINLTYYQVLNAAVQEPGEETFWQKIKEAVGSGWEAIGEIVIGLLYLWPLWMLVAAVLWWIRRKGFFKQTKVTQ
ncbi:DUF4349 domain-containing protein [Lacibacter luteus]|uniref:DUF4349 domain-containing protein n=1 Tax=Lacibacter luteus TaxID=2508719 RepID=A0A4Q1CML9_9BACT|nr:DUF4349 domain-containing protein [Lacibacter luteus]RXK62317.1 DUF4349 domain-containing protein [Lacibacter luteus]